MPIVTYCTGCKDRFMPKGKNSFHILEFLPGITPLQKPVSSLRRWINRFLLSFSRQIKSKKFCAGLAVVLLIVLSVYLGNQGYVSAELIFDTLKSHPIGVLIAAASLLLPLAFKPYFRKIMSTQNSSIEKDSGDRTFQQ